MLKISFGHLAWPAISGTSAKASLSLALLCDGAGFEAEALFRQFDSLSQGRISRACHMGRFTGKAGQKIGIVAPVFSETGERDIAQIQLIGCGPSNGAEEGEMEEADARSVKAGASAYHALTSAGIEGSEAVLLVPEHLSAQAARIALGASLRSYSFDKYRTKDKKSPLFTQMHLALATGNLAQKALENWEKSEEAVRDSVFLARDLVSEPANILTPDAYRRRIESLQIPGLEVEVLDRARMKELGFGALLGVAQGSEEPPYTVIMRYHGAGEPNEAPLAFVGKGVTFDTGGISIKPAAGMDEMKTDMGGSAAVVGVMALLARRRANINAVGIVGLVENMPSGTAQRPGDIVTSHSGQTIEVLNTDAEGRLVLADLLSYINQTCKPRVMINLATLTGAIVVALGEDYAGLFSNHDVLAEALQKAGDNVQEKLWRMPMGAAYNKRIDSPVADMKNIGGRPGSAILAAEFLKRFVGETAWAHLDIAGTTWKEKSSASISAGATGYGVRLLDAFVREEEKKASNRVV